jgi:MFS family permease
MLYLIYGLLLSFGFNTAFSHTSNAAIANWFVKKRSRAFAIYTLGAGIGGTIGVSLLSRLIVNFGWRYAAVAAGIAVLVVCLPLALTVKHKPEQCGLLPDGIAQEAGQTHKDDASATANVVSEPDFTLKEALKTSSFWVYTLGAVFRSVLLSSIVVHEIPHLMNVGFTEQVAGDILALMTFVSIPGRIVFGWAGDYFPKKYLLSISHILQAAGLYIFANVTSMEQAYLFVLFYGLGYGGAIPLVTAIRGDMFGRKSFATISGIVMPITTLGGVVGPIFAGYVFDVTLSYQLAFYAFTVTALLAAVTFLFVKAPKKSTKTEDMSPTH